MKLEAGQLGRVDCGEVSATALCVTLSGKDEAVTSAQSACCASRASSRYLDANQLMILQCRRKSALSTLPASAPQVRVQRCRPQFAELRRSTQQVWCSRPSRLHVSILRTDIRLQQAASELSNSYEKRPTLPKFLISSGFFSESGVPSLSSFGLFFPSGLEGFFVTRARGLPYCSARLEPY